MNDWYCPTALGIFAKIFFDISSPVCRNLWDLRPNAQVIWQHYLVLFFFCVALEYPWYALMGNDKGRISRRIFTRVLMVNLLTHPLVVFVLPSFFDRTWDYILYSECFAFVVEVGAWKYLAKSDWYRSIFASFIANSVSWNLGAYLLFRLNI